MKKIKSPWYGAVWMLIWTAAIIWFAFSDWFNTKEFIGLVIVWAILCGVTGWLIVKDWRIRKSRPVPQAPKRPNLNAPCPCGSGKKYKRCCGTV
jgi:hypothetical protein